MAQVTSVFHKIKIDLQTEEVEEGGAVEGGLFEEVYEEPQYQENGVSSEAVDAVPIGVVQSQDNLQEEALVVTHAESGLYPKSVLSPSVTYYLLEKE